MVEGPKLAAWQASNWYLAEVLHVLAGALILFAGLTHGWHPGWLYLGFAVATGIKEFIVDVSPFEDDSWSDSAQDWIAYQNGAICGLLAYGHFWTGVIATVATILALFVYDLVNQ